MTAYGRTNYPGLEGFTLTAKEGKLCLKSTRGMDYSPRYLFDANDTETAVTALENGDSNTLNSIAKKNHSPVFFSCSK